ncbi:hypothetical protein AAFN47_26955 [Hoeflea sp. CAU 1731]
MDNIEIDGIVHDLSHLRRFIVAVPGKGRDNSELRVAIRLRLHTISRSCVAGEDPNMHDENGQARVFCEDRYTFSLGLPEIARRMVEQNYFCWESSDRNRSMNYAVVDVAPGRIRNLQNGEHYVIFFYLYPSGGTAADVDLHITSCYLRFMHFDRIKRRYNLHTVLRKCLFDQKRVP